MLKNFDETVRLQSEKRQEWIQEIRGEKLQGIAEGASSALCLASSSPVLFPGRKECPETRCRLIEQEDREDSSCQICHRVGGKRKDGEEDNESQIIGEEKWQTCWCCRDPQRACRMSQASAEKLEHTSPAEKKGVASVPQKEQ